ncbi:GGDEF domain-containing protein [filamentous cyanobacterium CCP5]|nr:GGDEF domain-containing protein [filamentous cyanobacterium CCP5]
MDEKAVRFLEQQPKWLLLLVSVGLALLIGGVDFAVRIDLGLSIFYLIPIAMATWAISFRVGIVLSILCTIAWFRADIAAKDYDFSLLPYWNAAVRFGFFIIVSYLLQELRTAYQREQNLARIDSLTQISNRRFFLELLQTELDRARRYSYALTLAYLDVDEFKWVNDHLGHAAGDHLLQSLAQILRDSVRSHDAIARMGGDEFVILLPQTDFDQAHRALSRTHGQLNALSQSRDWPVGFSMGAVTFTTLPDSTDALIAQADRLMYDVKQGGKNRLKFQQYINHAN